MPWDQLEDILTSSALDRETKLMAIDLIARVPDESLVEEVIQLLSDWKESDDASQETFRHGMEKIVHSFEQKEQQLAEQMKMEGKEVADSISSQTKIDAIRAKIESM